MRAPQGHLLALLTLPALLTACATAPYTYTSPATMAAKDAYRACASSAMASYRSQDATRDKAAIAVASCPAQREAMRAAIEAENGHREFGLRYSRTFMDAYDKQLAVSLADQAMRKD